jgi:hypothetical protein
MTSTTQSIVVTVFEGRNFAKKPDHVYIQCRFNNEILTTDPVHQTTTPIWDTELVWNIDHKQLSYLRSVRAKLKLLVYLINRENQREEIGFVILDLRAASVGEKGGEKWYPLIKTTSPFRPELKLSFLITSQRQSITYSPTVRDELDVEKDHPRSKKRDNNENPTAVPQHADLGVGTTSERPIPTPLPTFDLFQQGTPPTVPVSYLNGYYQVGSYSPSQTFFTLFVTISFAEYVTQLHPYPGEYYFYYQFLGMDIRTQSFESLDRPDFPAERLSIHLHAYKQELSTLLAQIKTIAMFLCNGDVVVGVCEVGLGSLSVKIVKGEDGVEEYVLPVMRPEMQVCVDKEGHVPTVGVSLAVMMDVDPPSLHKQENGTDHVVPTKISQIPVKKEMPDIQPNLTVLHQETSKMNQKLETNDIVIQPKEQKKEVHTVVENTTEAMNTINPPPQSFLGPVRKVETNSYIARDQKTSYISTAETQMQREDVETYHSEQLQTRDEPYHEFRVSIELRAIKNVTINSATAFLTFTYTPFTSIPVSTTPVPIRKSTEGELVVLDHCFTSFEVIKLPALFYGCLQVPLVVEMWHRDETGEGDVKIGSGTVVMGGVRDGRREWWCSVVGSDVVPVGKVCDVHVLVTIQDFGPVSATMTGYGSKDMMEQNVKETEEYQTALELEIWKQHKQKEWTDEWKVKEEEWRVKCERELRDRDEERQSVMNEKMKEYQEWLGELESVSRRLESREEELMRRERGLEIREEEVGRRERKAEKREEELKVIENGMNQVIKDAEKRVKKYEESVEKANKERDQYRQQCLEFEVGKTKKEEGETEEWKNKMELLKKQNKEWEEKLERVTKSRHELKKKYKGLHDLYVRAKSMLLQDKENIYVGQGGTNNVDGELKGVKRDVETLRGKVCDPVAQSEMERLKKEKEFLISTGYDEEDGLVQAITSKIQSFTI